MRRRKIRTGSIVCAFVALADAAAPEGDAPVWVQVALGGVYKGYAGGEVEFTFDALTFSQIVANFRRHPAYVAGSDGVGSAPVVAWDFNHASEMNPTEGGLPLTGAPSQGWVHELEVRQGPTGVPELW